MTNQKSNDLLAFLRMLADYRSIDEIETCADMLHDIYSDSDFRHQYSLIYPLFVEITSELKSRQSDKIAIIVTNLEGVIEFCEETEKYSDKESYLPKIKKLYDHVSLEYQRFQCTEGLEASIEELNKQICVARDESENHKNEVEALKKSVAQTRIQSTILQDTFGETDKKIKDLESSVLSQIIAVLGIFVAIVVACFGTMEILGNIAALLANDVPLYKVFATFFVMALAFLDILAVLVYFIGRLCGKSISAACEAPSCQECSNPKKCNRFRRIWKRFYHVLLLNIVLFFGMIASFFAVPLLEKSADNLSEPTAETTTAAGDLQESPVETEWITEFQTGSSDTSVPNE